MLILTRCAQAYAGRPSLCGNYRSNRLLLFFSVTLACSPLFGQVGEISKRLKPNGELVQGRDTTSVYTLTPLGAVRTGTNFLHPVLDGTKAYVCAPDSYSVVDISSPSSLSLLATGQSPLLQTAEGVRCGISGGRLVGFIDADSTQAGNQPGLAIYNISDPQNPTTTKELALNKRFFNGVHFRSTYAFVPTLAITYLLNVMNQQYGDVLAVSLADPLNPSLVSTLRTPVTDPVYGSVGAVFGISSPSAGSNLIYVGGSTSTGGQNTGLGRLQVVDTTNPAAMTVAHTQTVAGTVHLAAPLVDGNLGVSLGNTGGFATGFGAKPAQQGNIVVVTFDLATPQTPVLRAAVQTQFKPGIGGGAVKVGTNLYAFAGVRDVTNQEVLLVVNATDPVNPTFQPIPIANPMMGLAFQNNVLYAAEGKAGFNTYSLGSTSSQCGLAVDLAIVIDRSVDVSSQLFAELKSSAQALVDQLRQSDRVTIVSFTTTGTVNQTLTSDRTAAKNAIAALTASGQTSIGAGIASAQQELLSVRRNLSAQSVMVVFSDGRDLGSANGTVTPTAATNAKNAGIRLMTVAIGSASASIPGKSAPMLWAGVRGEPGLGPPLRVPSPACNVQSN